MNLFSLLNVTLQVIGDPIEIQPRMLQSCTDAKEKFICKDCYTLQTCEGINSITISCAAQYPGRPYCYTSPDNLNTCVATPTKCKWTEFNCPSVGYHPNMENCKAYYACSSTDADSAVIRYCQYNTVYNAKEKICKTNTPCYTPITDCAGQSKIIPYKPNNNYYVICQGGMPPKLEKCAEGLIFDKDTLDCNFQCTTAGFFPYPGHKNKFINCFYNGKKLIREDEDCGDNEEFNEVIRICAK